MNPPDQLILTGLQATGHHGVYEHERAEGQLFLIDLTLNLSLAEAAVTDDLNATVNYGELAERVVAAVESDPVDLIETVAERVAAVALSYERVTMVGVTIHKPNAPISVPFTDVSVTLWRGRS